MPLEGVGGDIVLGPGVERARPDPRGIRASELDADQRSLLLRLIETHLDDLHPDLRAVEQERLAGVSPSDLRFLWHGGTEVGEPHYYRLHVPHFVIEHHNVRAGANHVHCVWREPDGDFGP